MTRPNVDPDELLAKVRQSITRGLQLQSSGDIGPAMAWLADAATAMENLDAHLTMGGRLPWSWKRAKAAVGPSAVDRSTVARCGAVMPGGSNGTVCTRLRGHTGLHKHQPTNTPWR